MFRKICIPPPGDTKISKKGDTKISYPGDTKISYPGIRKFQNSKLNIKFINLFNIFE